MVRLVAGQRCAGQRPKKSVDFALVISFLVKRGLNIGNDLIGRQAGLTGVDRAVIRIVGITGIVTPGREPEAGVPIIIAAADQDDVVVVMMPPIVVVPFRMVVLERFVMLAVPVLGVLDMLALHELLTLHVFLPALAGFKLLDLVLLVSQVLG